MSASKAQVREITGTESVTQTFRLRYDVWSGETALRPEVIAQGVMADEHDVHARHWAAFDGDGRIVAAARLCMHRAQDDIPDAGTFRGYNLRAPIATLARLIVRKTARKQGLARRLDECRIDAARKGGAACCVGTAHPARVAALQKLGFRLTDLRWTPSFAVSAIFHGMVLTLSGSEIFWP